MNTGLIADRYASALLAFANQSDEQDRVYLEAKTVSQSFSQFSNLRKVLDNPMLIQADKRKSIGLSAGGDVCMPFERFTDLILENKREAHLLAIMMKYVDLYRKQKNIHVGKLTTAAPLEPLTEKRLITLMEKETGGTVEVEKVVDPAILGGFLFEVGFVRWDASIYGQLQHIKNEFLLGNKSVK